MRFMHNKQVPGDGNWGLSTPVRLLCTTRTPPERQTSYIDSEHCARSERSARGVQADTSAEACRSGEEES